MFWVLALLFFGISAFAQGPQQVLLIVNTSSSISTQVGEY